MSDAKQIDSPPPIKLRLGEDEMAKYPFLADAGDYLKGQGFSLAQFGVDPDLVKFLDKAVDRIEAAASGKNYSSGVADGTVSKDASALPLEVFSFILAVVLLKLAGQHTLVRRFALREAMRAERHLERDLKKLDRGRELAIKIIEDLFHVTITIQDGDFTIPVFDYIENAVDFREREWKLVNRRVEGGRVFLTPHESVRLVRSKLGSYIASKVSSAGRPEMLPGYEKPVNKLVEYARKQFPQAVTVTTEHPPCIKHGVAVLERGENLPHSGRFMLATFLLNRGQSIADIAPLFKNAPDYNERTTLYQLNHLAGSSGGTKYSCPSCEKLKGQDLCFAIPECDGIINPLQFGKKRGTNA